MSPLFLFALVLLSGVSAGRSLTQAPQGEGASGGGASVRVTGCTVVINEVVHKPEDVGEVKGMDFVEFYNPCEEGVDLSGWSIADEDDARFVMGQDGCEHFIGRSEFLVLFRNNPCSFEFGYTGVDKATLRNAAEEVVMVVEWGKEDANAGRSWSAIPDGSTSFQDGRPTPGVANEAYTE